MKGIIAFVIEDPDPLFLENKLQSIRENVIVDCFRYVATGPSAEMIHDILKDPYRPIVKDEEVYTYSPTVKIKHLSFLSALTEAKDDKTVFKITFELLDGDRCRLVTRDQGITWVFESLKEHLKNAEKNW